MHRLVSSAFGLGAALLLVGTSVGVAHAQDHVCYAYDNLGRIVSATYLDGSQITYAYDTQGNRTHLAHNTGQVASCATPSVPASFPGQPAANQSPSASNDTAAVDTTLSVVIDVLANDSDPDGNNLSISSVTQPSQGSAAITHSASRITYTASSVGGSFAFNYTISDGNGGSASAVVTVTVTAPPSNNPPNAVYDYVTTSTFSQIVIPVLANDSDPDGDTLTVTSITQPSTGAAMITGGGTTVTYSAGGSANFIVFSYTISDGNGGTDTDQIAVNVTGGGGFPF